jgi:DNA invertase Pin-like site-specific DNA recombinase
MVKAKDDITKYKVFFRRDNGTSNIEIQESADAKYREKYLPSEILIMNENGVSANANIEMRPQMKRLIQMIKNNQVDIVYVYDLSRLFRDFYKFNYFVTLCNKNNVKIFYTSTGIQHQDNILLNLMLSY